ncbi:MAG: hypothetical protein U0V04_09350 [Spirosomataceae bacterium]|jgi:hypothetical protein
MIKLKKVEKIQLTSAEFITILQGNDSQFQISKSGILILENIQVSEFLYLDNVKFDSKLKTLNIKNCIFEDDFELVNSKIDTINVSSETIFEKDIRLTYSEVSILRVSKIKIHGSFEIFGLKSRNISLNNIHCKERLEFFQLSEVNSLTIYNPILIKELIFSNVSNECNSKIHCRGSKCVIKTIILTAPGSLEIISNGTVLKIKKLLLKKSFPEGTTLRINNPIINNISTEELINKGFIYINNISETELIDFKGLEIGQFMLENSDFTKTNIKIKSSNLNALSISNCIIPPPNKFNEIEPDGNINKIEVYQIFKKIFENKGNYLMASKFHEAELNSSILSNQIFNKKDIYSQLKRMFEQRGDSVKSLEYQAKELEEYRKSINWGNRFWEKLNLTINKITNNYGTNWAQALLVTLVVNGVFFTIFSFSLGYLPGKNLNLFWELFSYSPEFLNPLRKAEFIEKIGGKNVEYGNWSRIIDYSARIFVTICVYQLIQAFRKYGKK